MQANNRDNKIIPYGKYIPDILNVIFDLLKKCHDIYSEDKSKLTPDNQEVYDSLSKELTTKGKIFAGFDNDSKDKHLTEGLYPRHRREKRYPRLWNLTIQSYLEAKKANLTKGIAFPSPLNILFKYLTIPEHQESSAYALFSCRSFLYHIFSSEIENKQEEIFDAVSSFKRHIRIQAKWPRLSDDFYNNPYFDKNLTNTIRMNFIVGHFFAMRGISYLWFKNEEDLSYFLDKSNNNLCKLKYPNYHFRLSVQYESLPSNAEIINLMYGIPIPLSGMDTVLFGGLRKAANNGLVVSLSGHHGSGKTTFALALAISLSPFYTKSLYITLEEGEKELKNRLLSIEPSHFDDMSIYSRFSLKETNKNDNDWFQVYMPEPENYMYDFESFLQNTLIALQNELKTKKVSNCTENQAIENVCPALVIIDNLNVLLKDNVNVQKFVDECRKLNALVLLISGAGIPEKFNLDYLVDVTVELTNRQLDVFEEKPIRVLTLKKTRHQLSRTGSHLFHLSGDKGFRISPQIPSQLDKQSYLKRTLPDKSFIIHTFNTKKENDHGKLTIDKILYEQKLDIYPNSNILIHGSGSAGKAGLAMKLLMTPPLPEKDEKNHVFLNLQGNDFHWAKVIKNRNFSNYNYSRKILILSFLYPEEYYEELQKSIQKDTIDAIYPNIKKCKTKILAFYAGFLTAEDLLNKITKELDAAYFSGDSYTGILLDGMHNVFLQFRKLQERDLVWPMLYNIFSRYNLTVVTTFTNFKIDENIFETGNNGPDALLMQKGQVPFLHTLVKATDFYIRMEEITAYNKDGNPILVNRILPKLAISQDIDVEKFKVGWDKYRKYLYSLNDYRFEPKSSEQICASKETD